MEAELCDDRQLVDAQQCKESCSNTPPSPPPQPHYQKGEGFLFVAGIARGGLALVSQKDGENGRINNGFLPMWF